MFLLISQNSLKKCQELNSSQSKISTTVNNFNTASKIFDQFNNAINPANDKRRENTKNKLYNKLLIVKKNYENAIASYYTVHEAISAMYNEIYILCEPKTFQEWDVIMKDLVFPIHDDLCVLDEHLEKIDDDLRKLEDIFEKNIPWFTNLRNIYLSIKSKLMDVILLNKNI